RAGLNKFFDLAEEPRSHEFRRRENQQTVAHAIGQQQPAILHRHASEHDLRRGHITVVAWRQRWIEPLLGRRIEKGLLTAQVADVSDEQTALKQKLTARQIFVPWFRLLPPSLGAFVMNAP